MTTRRSKPMPLEPTETVDHEARSLAMAALEKIEGHEKLCSERWTNVRNTLTSISRRQWWLITMVIVGEAAIISMLIENGL